jgi:hypothetical protein
MPLILFRGAAEGQASVRACIIGQNPDSLGSTSRTRQQLQLTVLVEREKLFHVPFTLSFKKKGRSI